MLFRSGLEGDAQRASTQFYVRAVGMDQNLVVVKASRRVFRYRLGWGKGSIQTACGTRVERYLHPVSSDAKVLRAMKHIVANPANAARLGRILKSCRAPKTAGIEETAAKATPLAAWWAPLRGQTKFVALTIRSRRLLGYLWIRRVFLLGKSRQSTLTASPATVSKRDSLILVSLVACHCFHWGASIFTTSRQIPRPVPSGNALGYCKVYSIVPCHPVYLPVPSMSCAVPPAVPAGSSVSSQITLSPSLSVQTS